MIQIVCPQCGFQREIPKERLPAQPVVATCPRCNRQFSFDPEQAKTVTAGDPPLPPPVPPVSPAAHREQPARSAEKTSPAALQPVGALWSATWELYKRRWLLLIGIMLGTAVASVVPPFMVSLFAGVAKGSFAGAVAFIMTFCGALICSLVVVLWGMAAGMIAVTDEQAGFRDAVERAQQYWIPLAWVSGLYSFIVGGASVLLLLPGLVTGIWFFACAYLMVAERLRGMDALLTSKALVDGRFWPVAGRLALVWLMGTVLGMLPVIGAILSLLAAPFTMLYSYLLYQDLRRTAVSVPEHFSDGSKAGWLVLGAVGWLALPLMIFALAGAAFLGMFMPIFKQLMQQHGGQQILQMLQPLLLFFPGM